MTERPDPMTKHEELERLARAATPGPWTQHFRHEQQVWPEGASFESVCSVQISNVENWTDNAAFIAAANPATILDLLAANRKMREAASLVLETNDRIVDAMLAAKDERTAASISLKGSDEFTATLAVLRSALTTQRGDGE